MNAAENRKYVILQADGLPDEGHPDLDGRTPLEAAETPNLDGMAAAATVGLVATIPPGMPPGSDIGNLSLLGYDPGKVYTGRAPIEAAAMGIRLASQDVGFRCNLVSLSERDGKTVMEDYSAGHIPTEDAARLIEAVGASCATEEIRFYPGVSYRHLMVWRGGSDGVALTPPHDISGQPIDAFLPSGESSGKLRELIEGSRKVLADHPVNRKRTASGKRPANSVWFWGQGRAMSMERFEDIYGIRGGVISAVDVVRGVGACAGFSLIDVPGVTGFIDTNYSGKVNHALEALERLDLVFLHIEATDETGHMGDLELKLRAIRDLDSEVVGPLAKGLEAVPGARLLVTSDHRTTLSSRTHVLGDVPFMIHPALSEDGAHRTDRFVESAAAETGLRFPTGRALLEYFLGRKAAKG